MKGSAVVKQWIEFEKGDFVFDRYGNEAVVVGVKPQSAVGEVTNDCLGEGGDQVEYLVLGFESEGTRFASASTLRLSVQPDYAPPLKDEVGRVEADIMEVMGLSFVAAQEGGCLSEADQKDLVGMRSYLRDLNTMSEEEWREVQGG